MVWHIPREAGVLITRSLHKDDESNKAWIIENVRAMLANIRVDVPIDWANGGLEVSFRVYRLRIGEHYLDIPFQGGNNFLSGTDVESQTKFKQWVEAELKKLFPTRRPKRIGF